MKNQHNGITVREYEVLKLIVDGYSDRQIAERLCITIHTVNAYRKILLKKLNANNVASMVRIAILSDLVKF
jgi:DNA-binding CsgD family transcriptional regulator